MKTILIAIALSLLAQETQAADAPKDEKADWSAELGKCYGRLYKLFDLVRTEGWNAQLSNAVMIRRNMCNGGKAIFEKKYGPYTIPKEE